MIKVAACRVKPYELIPREKVEKKEVETLEETYSTSEEKLEKDDDEKTVEKFYIAKDAIGVKYMEMERSVCFLENMIFTVEVPVSEHNVPEVKDAKVKEIKNLEDYETFEMVEDIGQETIGSLWIITKKEKQDCQKTE